MYRAVPNMSCGEAPARLDRLDRTSSASFAESSRTPAATRASRGSVSMESPYEREQRSACRKVAKRASASADGSARSAHPSHSGCRGERPDSPKTAVAAESAPRRSASQLPAKRDAADSAGKPCRLRCCVRRLASFATACCATARKLEGRSRRESATRGGAMVKEKTQASDSRRRKYLATRSLKPSASFARMLSRKALALSTSNEKCSAKGKPSKNRQISSMVSDNTAASQHSSDSMSLMAFQRAFTPAMTCCKPVSKTRVQ
mmetsp:Transcript_103322/g.296678  ORF Transcript_103322/g.296678 Transcript_103322/m.296678 type:complete len:262 (-) Transcript_103322:310-1095(-)